MVNASFWQLGTASGSMINLPEPDLGSIDRTLVSIGGTHSSITGSQTKDVFGMKRGWTLTWSTLQDINKPTGLYWTIQQFWDPDTVTSGAVKYRGIGPFFFNDPVLPRLPLVNIMSVTDASKARNSNSLVMTLQEV
jgi:hypothetical protein